MIKTGLVSITFRQLSVEEVISLVVEAGLDGIEWGGDVHVPHGDVETASRVRGLMLDAGLTTAAYGSYYRVGDADSPEFDDVLASAAALGAEKIRVWAGRKGSKVALEDYRKGVIADAQRIADIAAEKGMTVVSEWHSNTLTDELDSAMAFLADIGRENFRTYWQPLVDRPVETCLTEIDEAIPYLVGLHVYAWAGRERVSLAEHLNRWQQYFNRAVPAGDFYALMEFVKDDSPKVFLDDAAILKNMVGEF